MKKLLTKVHKRYRCFASAVRARPDHWGYQNKIKEDLMLDAHKDSYIVNTLSSICAKKDVVQRYIDGRLNKEDEMDDDNNENCLPSRWDMPEATFGQCNRKPRANGYRRH